MPPENLTPDNASLLDRLGPATLLAPGPSLYLTGEENLRVTSFGSLAGVEVAVRYRLLLPTGRLQAASERHVPNSDRTIATSFHALAEGWLSGVEAFAAAGTPRRGQVYVTIELMRGAGASATPLQVLWSGYITDTTRRGWPAWASEDPISGRGVLRSITGANPAAGSEISETVPTNARWILHGMFFTLVASGAAANREVVLVLDDGVNIFLPIHSGLTQTAGQTIFYGAGNFGFRGTSSLGNSVEMPLPPVPLQGAFRFRTQTSALQAGDDYSAPQYLVEEWLED